MIYDTVRTPLGPLYSETGHVLVSRRWAVTTSSAPSTYEPYFRSSGGKLRLVKPREPVTTRTLRELPATAPTTRHAYVFVRERLGFRNKRLVVARCVAGLCDGTLSDFEYGAWCTLDDTRRMCRVCNARQRRKAA